MSSGRLLALAATAFVVIVIPGPRVLFVITTERRQGARTQAKAAKAQYQRVALLALGGVARSFPAGRTRVHAVRGIHLSIAGGETVAPLGPSGGAKSTAIDTLLGLDRARGSAAFGGGVSGGARCRRVS